MFEVLNHMLECTEFVSRNVTANVADIRMNWDQCSQTYAGVVDKINITWRAPVDTELLEEFPDLRAKLAKKLEWLANEQLTVLHLLVKRMFQINECLRTKLDNINNKLEKLSFEEHYELKHSVREHVNWLEDCWTCLHCFYLQLDFALISLQTLDQESANDLVDAVKQDENEKLTIGKSQTYTQSCSSLIKFLENKSKIKIT